jgi:sodium-coupled neutral amino acid transporter 10
VLAAQVGYGVSLLATIPLVLLPLQATLGPWLGRCAGGGGGGAAPGAPDHLITAGILGAACVTAMVLPNVEYVFGLAGSTAAVVVSFIFPAAIFLQTTAAQRGAQGHGVDLLKGSARWRARRHTAVALLLFGAPPPRVWSLGLRVRGRLQLCKRRAQRRRLDACLGRTDARTRLCAHPPPDPCFHVAFLRPVLRPAGVVAGVACTHALVVSIHQESEVVQLAQALVREERKVEAATSTEAAAKAAAQQVGAVVQAQRRLNETRRGAGAAVDAVARAAGALEAARAALGRQRGAAAKGVRADLRAVVKEAGALVAALEDAAASLAAAAARLREEGGGGGGASEVQAAGAAGREQAADALDTLAEAAQDALAEVRRSRGALVEAQAAAGAGRAGGQAAADALDGVLQAALGATVQAADKLNATLTALQAAEAEKTTELIDILARLAQQEDAAEAQLVAAKREADATAALTAGRKTGGGSAAKGQQRGGRLAKSPPPAVNATGDNAKAREALKRVSEAGSSGGGGGGGGGGALDVQQVANAAADAAADVLQAAKVAAGQAVESKSADVAGRAIEIAAELAGAGRNSSGAGAAASAIATAASKREEAAAQEELLGDNDAIAAGTVVGADGGQGAGVDGGERSGAKGHGG